MMEKIYAIIPKRSIVILIACISGVLLIVLAGIVPQQMAVARLDNKIAGIQFQIEEQKRLQPLLSIAARGAPVRQVESLAIPCKEPPFTDEDRYSALDYQRAGAEGPYRYGRCFSGPEYFGR